MRRLPVEIKLSPEDLRAVKRFQYGAAMTYCILALFLVVMIAVRGEERSREMAVENLQADVASQRVTVAQPRLAAVGGLPQDTRVVFSPLCAAKDLSLVTAIEAHGEAQDVASERLVAAAFAMLEARAACRDGRVAEGLAIYEQVGLGSVRSAHVQ